MTQFRQKDKKSGIVYVYEGKSVWDKEKKQPRYGKRKLIGHVDPETGEVVPNRQKRTSASFPKACRELIGDRLLLEAAAEESQVAAALKVAYPHQTEKVLSLAYYMICEGSSSLSRFARWASTHSTPLGAPLASQRISELLASITETVRNRFCARMISTHGEGQRLFYDTTSISSYSEHISSVRCGHNKDRVSPPQIDLAMLVGEQSGIPLSYRKVAGNIADVSTVQELLAEMDSAFSGKVRLVMDRGFWSAKNINQMTDRHYKFLIGAPSHLDLFKDTVDEHGAELERWEHFDDESGVYGMRLSHEWAFEKARPRKGEAKRDLSALLVALNRELASGNRIEAHERYYDEYFEVVRGRVIGKDDAIAAVTARAGYFALFSNEVMEPAQALAIYRGKDAIERRFSDVKETLDMRTPRVSTNETLFGELFITFVSLTLAAWLRRRMKETGLDEDYTLTGLLDEVETIERYVQEGAKTPSV